MFLSITTGRQAGLFSTPFSTAELKNQSMCDLAQRDPTHAQFKKNHIAEIKEEDGHLLDLARQMQHPVSER